MPRLNKAPYIKAGWTGNFDLATNLPSHNKIIGFTQLLDNTTWSNTKSKGVTHAYSRAGNVIPIGEKWETFKAGIPLLNWNDAYNVGRAITEGYTKIVNGQSEWVPPQFDINSVFTEELPEDGAIHFDDYPALAPAFFKGMKEGMNNGAGVAYMPRCYGSYVGGLAELSIQGFIINNASVRNPMHVSYLDGLDSEATARRIWNKTDQVFEANPYYFFQEVNGVRMSDIMGLLTGAYHGIMRTNTIMAAYLYSKVYEIQKKYAAGIKNTMIFSSTYAEEANGFIEGNNSGSGWVLPMNNIETGAYYLCRSHHLPIPKVQEMLAVIAIFLSDGISYWSGRRDSYLKSPTNMEINTPSNPVFWNAPTAPEPSRNLLENGDPTPGVPIFSAQPFWQQDYALQALDWYLQCKPILDAGGELMYFDYTANGTAVNVNTLKTADKRLFTPTIKPWGQNNILYLMQNQKGFCFGAYQGNNHFIVYMNPFLDSHLSETVIVNVNGSLINIGEVKGKNVVVFKS